MLLKIDPSLAPPQQTHASGPPQQTHAPSRCAVLRTNPSLDGLIVIADLEGLTAIADQYDKKPRVEAFHFDIFNVDKGCPVQQSICDFELST